MVNDQCQPFPIPKQEKNQIKLESDKLKGKNMALGSMEFGCGSSCVEYHHD